MFAKILIYPGLDGLPYVVFARTPMANISWSLRLNLSRPLLIFSLVLQFLFPYSVLVMPSTSLPSTVPTHSVRLLATLFHRLARSSIPMSTLADESRCLDIDKRPWPIDSFLLSLSTVPNGPLSTVDMCSFMSHKDKVVPKLRNNIMLDEKAVFSLLLLTQHQASRLCWESSENPVKSLPIP